MVKRFHVSSFKYEKPHRCTVDLWLRFAERRRAEDLCLRLNFLPPTFHILPRFLYCSSWVVCLEVSCCNFSLGRTSSWPCLKVLLIEFSDLRDDILEGIFRNSPVLESVQLRKCCGVNNIMIDSTSVKEFVLAGLSSYCTTKIWALNLLLLRVSGGWCHRAVFRLDDISSLVEAELDFNITTDLSGDERVCCDLLKEVLEKLHGVPPITIGGWCLQILSLLEMEGVPSPLSKCQNLILHAPVSPRDLPGIAYMLQSSQCLEKFVISLTDFPLSVLWIDKEFKERINFDEEEDFLCSQKGNFRCLAKHLKRVEITGFETDRYGLKHLLALIKLLLGDTLALEKMIIKAELCTRHTAVHPELLGVSRTVLSYRRASKNTEVIFNYPFK
ncbi:putative F-box/LRR-repeat protein At3g18150 isoform X3 [Syzygium oleosum]|uniref:putative F-box/LRR-repeat protein At3g18150 isoform X3 n=1 Tax=Syzygium oleosum TaxID=219896 RepID=UPI0024B95F45|nr:putative F-box/LRR-repeat protein At3g18150 isoform X3 [Syzygium oleosum]